LAKKQKILAYDTRETMFSAGGSVLGKVPFVQVKFNKQKTKPANIFSEIETEDVG